MMPPARSGDNLLFSIPLHPAGMAETAPVLHTMRAAHEAASQIDTAAALDQAIQDLRDIVWTARAIEAVADQRSVPLQEPQVSPFHATPATQPLWRRLHLLALSKLPPAHRLRSTLDGPPEERSPAMNFSAGRRSAA